MDNTEECASGSEGDIKLELRYRELAALSRLYLETEESVEFVRLEGEQKLQRRYEELAALTRLILDQERKEQQLETQFAAALKYFQSHRSVWGQWREVLGLFSLGNLRYVRFMQERRRTLMTGMFDTEWYLKTYPDVKEGGLDPVYHYLAFGIKEGRNPGPLFSTTYYLNTVGRSGDAIKNPLLHFAAQLMARTE